MKPARLVIRGHARDSAQTGKRSKQAPPITRDRLRQINQATDPDTLAGARARLLMVVGWALAGRRSEISALVMQDVTVDDDGNLEILIRASKTDKDSAGVVVMLPRGEHVDTDPVGLFRTWQHALAEQGVDYRTGPLLRTVTKHDRLFMLGDTRRKDGTPLRYRGLSPHDINAIVARAGLPDPHLYSAHSLRAGFVTQAARDGIPMAVWARHGRWKPDSPAPHHYVRVAEAKRDNPLRRMGL